jgi:hypothetical protein
MKKLVLLTCFFIITSWVIAQDKDSTYQSIEKLVDSAFKALPANQFKDLPNDNYFLIKIKFMNGSIKRAPFYAAKDHYIYVYSATDKDKLDTVEAGAIRNISFRMYQRTGKLVATAAGSGFLLGGIIGAAAYDCSSCDGDDFHIEQVWWGLGGAAAGGIIVGTAGLIAAFFNDGNFSIKGDTEKFRKQLRRINKFSVLK